MPWPAVTELRIFDDEEEDEPLAGRRRRGGHSSRSSLYADTRRGRRPGSPAPRPRPRGAPLPPVRGRAPDVGVEVATGQFGEVMEVELVNDGPFTIGGTDLTGTAGRRAGSSLAKGPRNAHRVGIGRRTGPIVGPTGRNGDRQQLIRGCAAASNRSIVRDRRVVPTTQQAAAGEGPRRKTTNRPLVRDRFRVARRRATCRFRRRAAAARANQRLHRRAVAGDRVRLEVRLIAAVGADAVHPRRLRVEAAHRYLPQIAHWRAIGSSDRDSNEAPGRNGPSGAV